jgi:hypothetical protein
MDERDWQVHLLKMFFFLLLNSTREKYDEAVRIFESMIWRYGEQDWSIIENSLLIKCAGSQKRLNKIDQYVESLLALLKNSKWLSPDQSTHYADELLENVGKLDKGKSQMTF